MSGDARTGTLDQTTLDALRIYIQTHRAAFEVAAQRRTDYFAALYARWSKERSA
jgi:N-formylglutamate amidohydrolase